MSDPQYDQLWLNARDVEDVHQALLVGHAVCFSTQHTACQQQIKEALDRLTALGVPLPDASVARDDGGEVPASPSDATSETTT